MVEITGQGRRICQQCGFDLFLPIADLRSSTLGLYDDGRFPGRSILALSEHAEHLDLLAPAVLNRFMSDVKVSVRVIKRTTGVNRVNVAILGNRDNHVHAHLIPRYPEAEVKPDSSPWDDPRPKSRLEPAHRDHLLQALRDEAATERRAARWLWRTPRSTDLVVATNATPTPPLFESPAY